MILVTGANGFVGRSLCLALANSGKEVVAATRHGLTNQAPYITDFRIGALNAENDWYSGLRSCDSVIHLAARVHVMRDDVENPLEAFREVNVAGTVNLARQAAAAGVRRLVYVSSIGVNGLLTEINRSYSETDIPNPHNAYALSKWEAEQSLRAIAGETGLEVVVIRPPLVYGYDAPGNFAQMMKVLEKGIPLPFASVHNLRSLIYVENLVDALILCAIHSAAVGQTYMVSDGEDISTSGLLRQLGAAMGCPMRLFPFPPVLLKLAGRLTGKSAQVERLLGSLQVDSGKIRRELGWQPPFTLQQGLQATAEQYRTNDCLRTQDWAS